MPAFSWLRKTMLYIQTIDVLSRNPMQVQASKRIFINAVDKYVRCTDKMGSRMRAPPFSGDWDRNIEIAAA